MSDTATYPTSSVVGLTFSDYLATVVNYITAVPDVKVGVATFNVLSQHRPDLANKALERGINPSVDPNTTEALLDWLAANWDLR